MEVSKATTTRTKEEEERYRKECERLFGTREIKHGIIEQEEEEDNKSKTNL